MALRIVPFGAFDGFSDQPVAGSSYYSQSFVNSLYGAGTLYSLQNMRTSAQTVGMGIIKSFAIGPGGAMFAQDDNGNILKEQTPGAFDFTIVRSPGGNGAGMMSDQYGNLFYACGSINDQLGKYDGTTWTDNFQSLSSWEHPMDTYEDLILVGNNNGVACLFPDGSWNSAAFSLPASVQVTAIRSGPTGILIGANFGYQGVLILWDGNALRSKVPWKWTQGQILSIDRYGENWIVKTQRQVLITNGITIKEIFGVFDDPLAFRNYDNSEVLTRQQILVINNTIIMPICGHASPQSYEYGKMKPGLYLYSLVTHTWSYIPVPTQSTISLFTGAVFADVNFNNRILFAYRDVTAGENFVAALTPTPPTKAQWISEEIGLGRIHYQRVFFGPTSKTAEAVILNLGVLNSITDPATLNFNVSLKIYNFKRQLWGHAVTNASLSSHNNQVQIDGTSASNYDAQVGDEVTILTGINAGGIAHITAIANDGMSNETWTLDTTFPAATENGISLQVQPFQLVDTQSFSGQDGLKNIYFNVDSIEGKQFLCKFVFGGIGSNLAIELQTSYFVFDDTGYDQFDDSGD